MPDRLTWEQIQVAYPDQWVVLADVQRDDRGGRVVGHGATREDADTSWRLGGELHHTTATRFTGNEVQRTFLFLEKFSILKPQM